MTLNTTELINLLNLYNKAINAVVDRTNQNTLLIYGLYAILLSYGIVKIIKWVLGRYIKIEVKRRDG